tara:strand:+ start:11189 stop:12397 length:1209 start_codon:yes stop_codon:yes gene_type:complete
MKIYTSVEWTWDDDLGKMVEVSSDSYDYEGELHLMGGEKGNNKDRQDDRKSMDMTVEQLENVLKQYEKAGDPTNSPFADAIERMRIDTETKIKESTDGFNLAKDQARDQYDLEKQMGQKGYADSIRQSKEQMGRMHQEATAQIQDARSGASDAAFESMVQEGVGGLAASGGRKRKILSEKAKQQVGSMTLGLKHARDAEKAQQRAQESSLSRDVASGAFAMDQKNETAEMQLDQAKSQLRRDEKSFVDEQQEAQTDALENLRDTAFGMIQDTERSFLSRHSTWGHPDSDSVNWDPWNKHFDDYDDEIGRDRSDLLGSGDTSTRYEDVDEWHNWSDERLKENIELVGVSNSGINIYEFDFKNKIYGEGRYVGVMAQEVPEAAYEVDGYLCVDYNKIDVNMRRV